MSSANQQAVALIVGASRGLGLALAEEYVDRGWQLIATVREGSRLDAIRAVQAKAGAALELEYLEVTEPAQIAALRERLHGRALDLLLVNAGVSNDPQETVGEVSTEEFVRVMVTNALSPLRIVERFTDLVVPGGSVAVMSSLLGSVSANTDGGWEVYRGSKAALNMLMRSYVARRGDDGRTYLAIAPGWVRTEMGGSEAPLDIQTSIPGVANAIERRRGSRGLVYVDYRNEILPW